MSENLESTQPNIKVIKPRRGRTVLFNVLGLIVILSLAILAGYSSGISIRKNTQSSVISQQLGEQFQYALVDIEFQRYENAKQRLEFIIAHDPQFPGAQDKLTQVLVLMNQPTPTLTPSLTPTPDFSGAEQAFLKAQQLITAQDWPGAIGTLDQIRKLDSTYKTSQVDGMYYFALRNYGYDLIVKQGNLEGGIYQFTLAERFGPLDRDANALRTGARYFLIGASFWELDWKQAVDYFQQVYSGYPGLWDGTSTASERFYFASMRYGDQLTEQGQNCDAVQQYQNAQAIAALDEQAQKGFVKAYNECYPPTPTVDLTQSAIPPTAATSAATEPPTAAPTEPPTAAPTEPSATQPATQPPANPGGGG
jgi:tetratricopeptide (TPR) repeat protein